MKHRLLLLLTIAFSSVSFSQNETTKEPQFFSKHRAFSITCDASSFLLFEDKTINFGAEYMFFKSSNDFVKANLRGGVGYYSFDFIFKDEGYNSYIASNILIGRKNSLELNFGAYIKDLELFWPYLNAGLRHNIEDEAFLRLGIGMTGIYAGLGFTLNAE